MGCLVALDAIELIKIQSIDKNEKYFIFLLIKLRNGKEVQYFLTFSSEL